MNFKTAADNIKTTLASTHAANASTLALTSATGFPNSDGYVTAITAASYQTATETLCHFSYTGVSGNTLTGVAVLAGQTDPGFAASDVVEMRCLAEHVNDLNTAVTPVVTTGISAAGTTQGTATAISAPTYFGSRAYQVVSTVASGTGVVLPTAVAGMEIKVVNAGANPLAIYPASGATINGYGANNPYLLGVGVSARFQATSTTQWYTPSQGNGKLAQWAVAANGATLAAGSNVPGLSVILPYSGNFNRVDISTSSNPGSTSAPTAITGQAAIFDILYSTNQGATWTSLFAAGNANKPQIAVGQVSGTLAIFGGQSTYVAGAWLRLDVLQAGTGANPGTNVIVTVY
jgi:hypothetical protein